MINFRTLSGQYINGEWRDGNSSLVMENKTHITGKFLQRTELQIWMI